jgi:hypothetical protein
MLAGLKLSAILVVAIRIVVPIVFAVQFPGWSRNQLFAVAAIGASIYGPPFFFASKPREVSRKAGDREQFTCQRPTYNVSD